jgi:3-keto-L-gulonate-6-phosphate decarboxylase
MASSVLETLSNDFAAAAEAVGGSVVAIYGRRWMPSSGIQWRKGVKPKIATTHRSRDEDAA